MAPRDFITTLSTKGQVILPKAVRDHLQWSAGKRLVVEHTPDGVLLRPMTTAFPATRPDDVFACLPHHGAPKSLEEMQAAIDAETLRRHASGRY
jgi:AbrB family looped-hinge helix DNA binding protein